MTDFINPFIYGRVLHPNEPACSRPELDLRLARAVKGRERIALSGDRRQGKSSLVPRAVAGQGATLLTLDLLGVRNTDGLCSSLAIQFDEFLRSRSMIARKLAPWLREIGIDVREFRGQLAAGPAGLAIGLGQEQTGLLRMLDRIGQIGRRTPLAVFIDEFQVIPDYFDKDEARAVLGALRSAIQRHSEVAYFFAGSASHSFNAIFLSEASPFFQGAHLLDVPSIPAADFTEFLEEQFQKSGKPAEAGAVPLILALAGTRANDVQQLAHETWYVAASRAERDAVMRGLSKILRGCESIALYALGNTSIRQQRALFCAAFHEGRPLSLAAIARRGGFTSATDYKTALHPYLAGDEPIVEALPGGAIHFRHHYLRMWFLMNRLRAANCLPFLRDDQAYRELLTPILAALPAALIGKDA